MSISLQLPCISFVLTIATYSIHIWRHLFYSWACPSANRQKVPLQTPIKCIHLACQQFTWNCCFSCWFIMKQLGLWQKTEIKCLNWLLCTALPLLHLWDFSHILLRSYLTSWNLDPHILESQLFKLFYLAKNINIFFWKILYEIFKRSNINTKWIVA